MSKKIITHNNGIIETRETFYTEKTIQQLKQQLDEKDKEIEKLKQQLEQANEIINNPNTLIAQQQELIESLNKQLGEKDARIADLEDKDWFEANIKQLEEQNNRLIDTLKEKDKEISRLKERLSVFDNFKDNYGYTNYDDSEILEDLQSRAFQAEDDTQVVDELLQFFNIFDENELVDKVKEPQTQLAIQELEKLKASADKWFEFWENSEYEGNIYDKLDVSNAYLQMSCEIDQQIKELKGEKK